MNTQLSPSPAPGGDRLIGASAAMRYVLNEIAR